jgi:hypothetical protein
MNKNAFSSIYLNRCFDKSTLKGLVRWALVTKGEDFTISLLEKLKTLGYSYATKAGISLSLDDLMIPPTKREFLKNAQSSIQEKSFQYDRGNLTVVERFQHLMDTWHSTSEALKNEVVNNFVTTNTLNPVYMMAFSGARGNLSQVRQLVGMRGLMSDPQGQIINFPIQSNFREGLTVTEYVISCYGARKGLVDTALRTANSGYLTRRLVDVAQHVIVSQLDCETMNGIQLTNITESGKVIVKLEQRLIGRVLAEDYLPISSRNIEINPDLASKLSTSFSAIKVRSPLTCSAKQGVCQLCYGWSLAHGSTVSLGEAVGVVAAQSIGEPGTQLTMRTFHTGGVFTGESMQQLLATKTGTLIFDEAIPGVLIRTSHGKIAFLTREEGFGFIHDEVSKEQIIFPPFSVLFLRNGEKVEKDMLLAEYSSISKQTNERMQAKQILTSELEGQVWFEKVVLGIKNNREGQLTKLAHNYGSLWVLAGQVIPVTFGGKLGVLTGDKLEKNAALNESFLTIPENGYLVQNNKKKYSLATKVNSFTLSNIRFTQNAYWLKNAESLLKFNHCLRADQSELSDGTNNFKEVTKDFIPFIWFPFLNSSKENLFRSNYLFDSILETEESKLDFSQQSSLSVNKSDSFENISATDFTKLEMAKEVKKDTRSLFFQKFSERGICISTLVMPTNNPSNFKVKKDETVAFRLNRQGTTEAVKVDKMTFVKQLRKTKGNQEKTPNFLRLTNGWFYLPNKETNLLSLSNNPFGVEKKKMFYKTFSSKSTKTNPTVMMDFEQTNSLYPDIIFNQNQNITSRIDPQRNSSTQNFIFENSNEKILDVLNKTEKINNWLVKTSTWKYKNTNSQSKKEFIKSKLWNQLSQENSSINTRSSIIFSKLTSKSKVFLEKEGKNLLFQKQTSCSEISRQRRKFISQKSNLFSKCLAEKLNLEILQLFVERNRFGYSQKLNSTFTNRQEIQTFVVEDQKQTKVSFKTQTNQILEETKNSNSSNEFDREPRLAFPVEDLQIPLQWTKGLKTENQTGLIQPYSIIRNNHGNLVTDILFGKDLQLGETEKYVEPNNISNFSNKKNPFIKTNQLIETEGEIIWLTNKSQKNNFNSLDNFNLSSGTELELANKKGQEESSEEKNQELLILTANHLHKFNLSTQIKIGKETKQVTIGKIVRIGDVFLDSNEGLTKTEIPKTLAFPLSGQICHIGLVKNSSLLHEKQKMNYVITLREANSVLFSAQGVFNVEQYDLVTPGTSLLTLFYQRLKTGDIVQGIPKIEEFFEARQTKQGEYLPDNLHEQLQTFFFKYQRSYPLPVAVRKSFQDLQAIIVNGVLGVYQSQGVTISDKHLEIIVRQMTSIVRVVNGGSLGLLPGELVHLDSIELFNRGIQGQTAEYEPIVLGITKASLETKSFISAASFQETTRILTRAAVAKKIDFLRGLKESVILGHLIPAGTGFFNAPVKSY